MQPGDGKVNRRSAKQRDQPFASGGDSFVLGNRLWHCSQCSREAPRQGRIGKYFLQRMNGQADAEKDATRFRKREESLMFDAQPNLIRRHRPVQSRKVAMWMLIQLRGPGQAPVGSQPRSFRSQFGKKTMDLNSDGWIQAWNNAVDFFYRPADLLL